MFFHVAGKDTDKQPEFESLLVAIYPIFLLSQEQPEVVEPISPYFILLH